MRTKNKDLYLSTSLFVPMIYIIVTTVLFLFLFATPIKGQVVINEFVPNASQEWVEFYNSGASEENLSDYFFDDDTDFNSDSGSSQKVQLSGLLSPSSTCYKDLSTFLNNDGDTPTLFKSDGSNIDSYSYSNTTPDKSYSRIPDGGVWQSEQSPTKSITSCLSLAPTSTPTPTPTSTLTATPDPTSAPTATSTPVPTPTKTPTPTPTKTPTPKPTITPTSPPPPETSPESEVLGLRNELNATPTPQPGFQKGKIPAIAFVLIGFGLVSFGFAAFSFLKNKNKGYNLESEEKSQNFN